MGTPLETVYQDFLGKVSDYNFIRLNKEDRLESSLRPYLNSSIAKFYNSLKDLSINEDNQEFVEDLNLIEREILSTYMTMYYVNGKILNVKNMEQNLSEREYRKYSEANHLRALEAIKSSIQSEVSHLETSYELREGLGDLL